MTDHTRFHPALFLIQTAHDTIISLRRESGAVRHASSLKHHKVVPLLYCQFGVAASSGFLVPYPPDCGMRWTGTQAGKFAVQPVQLLRLPIGTRVALRDPFHGAFLCAEPPAQDRQPALDRLGRVTFDRQEVDE